MALARLKKEELEKLLREYFAERRLLMYKLDRVREAITELKSLKALKTGADDESDEVTAVKRGPGRPKSVVKPAVRKRRKRGRPRKRRVEGGYRLNDWDNMISGAITSAKRLLTKQELLDHAIVWAKKNHPTLRAADVDQKVIRALVKLTGKRGVLGKHRTGKVRGLHYGLVDWFFHGKLRQEHKGKVILDEK